MLEDYTRRNHQIKDRIDSIALEATSPQSYRQIEPGDLLLGSFEMLAGCTPELDAFLEKKHKLNLEESSREAHSRRVFEDSAFVSWGRACFSIKKPGNYTIEAEQSNDTVVVSRTGSKVKTAVGRIQSSPLILRITE